MYHKPKTRAIAQLGRAPRLHVRQCFFRGVHYGIKKLIEKSMSYSMTLRKKENNSLTIWLKLGSPLVLV